MARDPFSIILNSKKHRSAQENDEKLKSLLNNKETKYYTKKANIELDDEDDDLNITFGKEKDSRNYIGDIERISLRDLDKKNHKEQLKILKLEYNRLFDRIVFLNDKLVAAEQHTDNLLLNKNADGKTIKQLKLIIRDFSNTIPGNAELKDLVNKGNWNPKQVAPLLDEAIKSILERLENIDEVVEKAISQLKEENLSLKKQILKHKEIKSKIAEIEEMILTKGTQQPTDTVTTKKKAENTNVDAKEEKQKEDNKKHTQQINKNENVEDTKHEPHFSGFFEEFTTGYQKMKKRDENEEIETEEQKHPLSPDFVETEKEKIPELFDDNIQYYLNSIGSNHEFIIKIIGETGISRNPDLRDYLKEHEEGKALYMKGRRFDYQAMSKDVSDLREKGFLNEERTSISTTIIYELSNIGKQTYKYLFKDDPVIPEKKRISNQHTSLEHGYMIKDSAKIFSELGYKVLTERKDVTIKLEDGRRKEFDLIVIDKEGKKMHIEVERGTHNKEDFFDAMNRIYKITKEFYFICPSDQVKNKETKQLFISWVIEVLGGIQKADVILNMTTINNLKKKPKNLWEVTNFQKNAK